MITDTPDAPLRTAAFEYVRRLAEIHDHLTAIDLKPGFTFRGERIRLINRLVLSAGRCGCRPSAGDLYMRIDLKRQGYNAADQGAAA
jgi:hypothetical protein